MFFDPGLADWPPVDIDHNQRLAQLADLLRQLQLHAGQSQRDPVNSFTAVHVAPRVLRHLRGTGLQVDSPLAKIAGA
ncbi:hypothetical protein D3C73_1308130 [compost metagenome]